MSHSAVARALIGGGGVFSYFRALLDEFLLKISSFQKKSVGQNTNIWIYTSTPSPQLTL